MSIAAEPPSPSRRLLRRVLPPWRRARIWLAIFVMLAAMVFGWMRCLPQRRSSQPLSRLLVNADSGARSRIEEIVRTLAGSIGPRYPGHGDSLQRAADYLRECWRAQGFEVKEQPYQAGGKEVRNLWVTLEGAQPGLGVIVVGAHYDTCFDTPGADDNASGVALLLELSRRLRQAAPQRGIYLVAFACEEPPYFLSEEMGSVRFSAMLCEEGVKVEGMISLESLGYYRDERKTQVYPRGLSLFYPDRGNFVAVVGNLSSRSLVGKIARLIKRHSRIPVETGALPGWLPGVGWSDHWAFWQRGISAVMLTDTAPFRNPHYHALTDTPDTLNYDALAEIAASLPDVILELAQ